MFNKCFNSEPGRQLFSHRRQVSAIDAKALLLGGDADRLSLAVKVIFFDPDEGAWHLGLAKCGLSCCVLPRNFVVALSYRSWLKGHAWCNDVLKLSTAALLMSELYSFRGR